jgi:hypothetical protein
VRGSRYPFWEGRCRRTIRCFVGERLVNSYSTEDHEKSMLDVALWAIHVLITNLHDFSSSATEG